MFRPKMMSYHYLLTHPFYAEWQQLSKLLCLGNSLGRTLITITVR